MKAYRIQARTCGKYLKDIIKANTDVEALEKFSERVKDGIVKVIDEDFYNHKKTVITYEELDESGEKKVVSEAPETRESMVI